MEKALVANLNIAVVGLGYVGLPLAISLASKYPVTGFDIDQSRIAELLQGNDHTLEINPETLHDFLISAKERQSRLTNRIEEIRHCNFYIVTVPTPVDKQKSPDLEPLRRVSKMIGQILKPGDIVVYESTVYPGATEEECVPVLESTSGLKFNQDFHVGYSPERINPGDKTHTFSNILKITSGSNPQAAKVIDQVYNSVITAGTYMAPSIKVAEAAKVIENAQRDVNIAFVNELAKIFNKLDIDTHEVLEAAGTKWNFLKFKPGLVGGHCIGVDPYYLAQRAQKAGYHPEVILSGRRTNDGMGEYVAHEIIKLMALKNVHIKGSRALILGFAFKENCPDIRNTKVYNVVSTLQSFGIHTDVYDPWTNRQEVKKEYQIDLLEALKEESRYDCIVLAVGHHEFRDFPLQKFKASGTVCYDIKGIWPKEWVDGRL
ncbi:nucleotide sugar dehydrogenase [Olivibacter sitiensis]|uniref:nucleotide sugar dehydrogenase n=1 Tax=Olivibacter sitiensis TaxID=376470 RepID=UPI000416042A|nr:nucleotide sugar dehydrogenase [Olivibacter sitiensis]